MASRLNSFAAVALLLAFPCFDGCEHLSAQDAGAWRERFLKEAPPAWEHYHTRAKRLQGSFSFTHVQLTPDRRVEVDRRHEFKQRPGCALFLQQSLVENGKPNQVGKLGAVNPRYGFQLHRSTLTGTWAISGLATDLRHGLPFYPSPSDEVDLWSTCPFTFVMISHNLRVIVQDPGFTLNQVDPVARDGREWAKVGFAYRPPRDKPRIPSIGGWVLFDPERSWVIRQYDVELEWAVTATRATMAATYDYDEAGDDFPILKRFVAKYRDPNKSYEAKQSIEFHLKEADVPESAFTLSAFGFPEPGHLRGSTPWYLVAVLVGFLCLGLAIVLHRRARRAGGPPRGLS